MIPPDQPANGNGNCYWYPIDLLWMVVVGAGIITLILFVRWENDTSAIDPDDVPGIGLTEWVVPPDRIRHRGGYAYIVHVPIPPIEADEMGLPERSRWRLYEDDQRLGNGHDLHDAIRDVGEGRYSHWRSRLIFSASDGSDPRINGRAYRLVREADLEDG